MPYPKPKKGESQDDFVDRCMSNDVIKSEHPKTKERYAVCMSQLRSAGRKVPEAKGK